jgi:hypothetical protein
LRFVAIIVMLAAIVVGQIYLRRGQDRSRHEVERMQLEQVKLRRVLYEQQAMLGKLAAPRQVRQRASDLAVGVSQRAQDDLAKPPPKKR